MADPTTITQVLPSPKVEASLGTFLTNLDYLQNLGLPLDAQGEPYFQGLDPSKFKPKIAPESVLQTDARTAAEGLGSLTGPDAFKPFMSPYQQEVIKTTLAEFDRQAAISQTGNRDRAIQAGAYGGAREGIMASEFDSRNLAQRQGLQAQLLAQGFQQAQAAAAQDLAARQGLGGYQSQLGQQQQAYDQAVLDANQIAAREAEFQPFTQLGLIGQQLAQIQPGAFPTQTVGYAPPAAPASPMSQFLGGAAGIAGIGGKLGLFG